MNRLPLLLAVAIVSPSIALSQPVTRLARPDFEYPAEHSNVVGVRELSNGDLIVLDRKEKLVLLLDAKTGESRRIGREGEGPGEYRRPFNLVALAGDTTLIEDSGNNRILMLGAAGKILGTMQPVQIHAPQNATYGVSPRGVDGAGRFYVQLPTGLVQGERIPIMRYNRVAAKFDTIASIANDRFGAQRGATVNAGGGASFGFNAPKPFALKDEWAVSQDGWIAIAHGQPYSVDWINPTGAKTTGAQIAFTPVRVTDAEKNKWRAQQRELGGGTLTTTGADGKTTVQQIPVPEPAEWPETMPAFVGASSVIAAPSGTVWIRRAAAASAKSVSYDIVDRSGKVVERVELPAAHAVVAFGKSAVYVIRLDEDGLQHIQRYARR